MKQVVEVVLYPHCGYEDKFNVVRLSQAHIEKLFNLFRIVRFEIAALSSLPEDEQALVRLLDLQDRLNRLYDSIHTFSNSSS